MLVYYKKYPKMKTILFIIVSALFSQFSFSQSNQSSGNKTQSPPTAPLPPAPMPPPPGTPRITHSDEASSNKLPPAQNSIVTYSSSKKDVIVIARTNADTLFITRADWNANITGFESRYGKLPPLETSPQVIKDYKATSDNFPVKKEKEAMPPIQKVKN